MKWFLFIGLLFLANEINAYDVIFNPYGGHNQYISTTSSNTLKSYYSGVLITSPTYSINVSSPLVGSLQGTTTFQISIDGSSVTLKGQDVVSGSSATATYVNKNNQITVYGATSTITLGFGANVTNGSTTTFNSGTVLILNSSNTIKGTSTSDNAPVGYIGEYISSTTSNNQAVGTSTQYFDIVSMSLTPGDWDISGLCYYSPNGATIVYNDCGIGTAAGNSSAGLVSGDTVLEGPPAVAAYQVGFSIPVVRKSISATTTYYLKGNLSYSVATPLVRGRLSARRAR